MCEGNVGSVGSSEDNDNRDSVEENVKSGGSAKGVGVIHEGRLNKTSSHDRNVERIKDEEIFKKGIGQVVMMLIWMENMVVVQPSGLHRDALTSSIIVRDGLHRDVSTSSTVVFDGLHGDVSTSVGGSSVDLDREYDDNLGGVSNRGNIGVGIE
ncbi:unnamed protein product [Dovyalis caffra]|uniref:Uncharacterized protein n=1 Tax=Dovyalis caffra TaxID=77055 RepID=A0AAV1SPR6_9ROSI|nr:unnamed protein product [Dovyalis caffra]